jgi:hypothetical protein
MLSKCEGNICFFGNCSSKTRLLLVFAHNGKFLADVIDGAENTTFSYNFASHLIEILDFFHPYRCLYG